ncbi:MAG: DNA adenine methylase [Aggregatilineales bacterium]
MSGKHNTARLSYFATPPLRYIGAKWQMADWILSHFPPHDVYVEPFCGSGAVFFRKFQSPVEVLNDKDGELVHFFTVLREQTDALVQAIALTPYARAEYELAQSAEESPDPVERARRFYVAKWMSFGGTEIYNTGWKHQKTNSHRSSVVSTWNRLDGIMAAAIRLKQAQIENRDAAWVIERYDHPTALFYVDPPYVKSSRAESSRNRYKHEMNDDDHRQLATVLHNVQGMVLLSGYECALYDDLYAGWGKYHKTTTANGNSQATECLWVSPNTEALNRLPLFAPRKEAG